MLDLAMAVLEAPEPHDPWPLVVRELTDALDAAAGVHAPLTTRGGAQLRVWTAGAPETSAGQAITQSPCAEAHPHLQHFAARPDDQDPRTMSDLLSDRAWRQHPVYTGSCGQYDALRQVSIALPGPGGRRSILAVGRSGSDFTDDDRAYLRQAKPLLAAVWAHVVHLDRWRMRLTEPAPARRQAADLGLTPRELTVLDLLAEGLTAQSIARRLRISPHTSPNPASRPVASARSASSRDPACATTPLPSPVTDNLGRDLAVFTWKVLRFRDLHDLDNHDHPRSRSTFAFRDQHPDTLTERTRLVADLALFLLARVLRSAPR